MRAASDELVFRPRTLHWHARLRELRAFVFLLRNLTARNLKLKYQRSFLGILWTLLNPLATTLTLIVVFSAVIRLPVEDYWAFLLSGFFVWSFISATLSSATYVLPQHSALLRAANVPPAAFVLAAVASRLLEFLAELALVALAVALFHHHALPVSFALLPVLVLAVVLLAVGLMLPIATLGAFYDDVQHSLPVAFMILFYLSPVFYPASLVPEGLLGWYRLNPLVGLLELYHTVLYDGRVPSTMAVSGTLLVGAIACAAGSLVFRRFRGVFAEVL